MTQPETQRPRSAESDQPLTQNDRRWRKGDLDLQIALAKGSTVRHAARAAGISERTAYRRLADPQFRGELKAVREQLLTTRIQHEAAGPQRDDPSGGGGAHLSGGSEAPRAETATRGPAGEEPHRSGATRSARSPAPSHETNLRDGPSTFPSVKVSAAELVAEARRSATGLTRQGADTKLWQPVLNQWLAAPSRDVNAIYEATRRGAVANRPARPKGVGAMSGSKEAPGKKPRKCTCGTQRRRPAVRRKCPVHGGA